MSEVPVQIDPATLAHLQSWRGMTEEAVDLVTAANVDAFAATLDRDDPPARIGTPLPELWHWMLFVPKVRQSQIGADGHPKRGGFLPPVPLPRRMWAASRLQWHAPIQVGDTLRRVSEVKSVEHKVGRSGELVFVTVQHEIHNRQRLAIREEHDIVYRAAPGPNDPPSTPIKPPEAPGWSREIIPDDVMLFRYSALTFNGHRIHYDRRYVTEVEGYPGLVVHGPLIATLLVDLFRRERPGANLSSFEFRAIRPTFDIARFKVCGEPDTGGKTLKLWAQDEEGWLTMQATATQA